MTTELADLARRSDDTVARARADLVRAVRQASAQGMTQQQIASAINRSQAEVSRLLHFHGTSPLARHLRQNASQIRRMIAEVGGRNLRVFGSVATETDRSGSDVDLLFTMTRPLSLMQLGVLERQIGQLIGADVDLVPDSALHPAMKDRILAEAVAA